MAKIIQEKTKEDGHILVFLNSGDDFRAEVQNIRELRLERWEEPVKSNETAKPCQKGNKSLF